MNAPVVIIGEKPRAEISLEYQLISLSDTVHVALQDSPQKDLAHETQAGRSAWIHGNAILGNQVTNDGDQFLRRFSKFTDLDDIANEWGYHAKNPAVAFVADHRTGHLQVLPDPLGGGIIFHWQGKSGRYISSSVMQLVSIAKGNNELPKKSLEFLLERSLMGNGGLIAGSYEGMSASPVGTYLSISANGDVNEKEYRSFTDDLNTTEPYLDVLLQAQQDIKDTVSAIGNFSTVHRIAHLTAGFDSRLVLAALIASGQAGNFQFFTSGPDEMPDREIADNLAAHLGLLRTNDGVLSSHPLEDLRSRVLAIYDNSAAMLSDGPTGFESYQSAVVLSGGYGELIRTFYPKATQKYLEQDGEPSGSELAIAMFGQNVLNRNGLATPDALEQFTGRLRRSFMSLTERGYRSDYIGDAHYQNYRNRYFVGQISVHWSHFGHRFDPLYSRHAVKLARMLPFQQRKSNIAGFDLMQSFAPELVTLPFDRPRFDGNFSTYRNPPSYKPFDRKTPKFVRRNRSAHQVLPTAISDKQGSGDRKAYIKEAKTLGVAYWQIAERDRTQRSLASLLKDIDSTELSPLIRMDYVNHLAHQRLRTRQEVRHLHTVHRLVLWYSR